MKELYNKSNRNYVHTVTADGKITTYRLKPKSKLNVPDDIAKIWLLNIASSCSYPTNLQVHIFSAMRVLHQTWHCKGSVVL